MSLLIMQHSVDFDLEEIESRLYSQVFHSTENWDQTPDHPVLNKVPERQVTTYSISNQTINSARYWDATITQAKKPPPSNENAVNNTAATEKPTENTPKSNETNDNDNKLQNNNDKNISKKVGLVEEYIGLEPVNATNRDENPTNRDENPTNRNETNIDFSKDDFEYQPNFYNSQSKLIQQSEIQKTSNTSHLNEATTNNLNNNTSVSNQCDDSLNPFAHLQNIIKILEQENTIPSKKKAKKLRYKLKQKQIKHERRTKRLLKTKAKEEKRLRKLGAIPNNNSQSFSFVNQFNNIQRKQQANIQNFIVHKSPVNSSKQSPIIANKETEKNEESIENQQQEIINQVDDESSFVILSDSDSNSDDVIEVPLPEEEIVYVDSSSENSDTDDTIFVDDNIVENIPSTPKISSNSITKENNVPTSPKLEENTNDYETTEINRETQLKSEGETINDTEKEQILKSDNKDKIEVMKDIEENATNLFENEEKINEIKSPNQTKNTSINEIEKERAELLFTPDSNTNDFMAHDVCNLNKTNFCFNFNLHDSDLDLSGKEISKAGPSITDVYETESSCSEAGTASKNRSYFSEVDFESPNKEIFAEPDLAKFSSFITPIRNRNISNVANSTPDLAPIKTKAGVVGPSSFQLNVFEKDQEGSCNSDEYNSDPTTLPVKKKIKRKKKKAKKKDTSEITEDKLDVNVIEDQTETSNSTEILNKPKKNKKKNKSCTYEELKNECFLLNQPDVEQKKISKAKERRLKKKNKRKSDQLENELDKDSSNKKAKVVTKTCDVSKENSDSQTKQKEENKKTDTIKPTNNIESLSNNSVGPKSLEELNSTVEYYDKVESYFADDILYKELENKNRIENSSNNLETTDKQIVEVDDNDTDADNSSNELIEIDTISSNSDTNEEKISFTNNFRKVNENEETQTINVSSDSDSDNDDTQILSQPNDENTSSSSGNNIVLNIFSPEKSSTEGENMVANPFSFVQNFEMMNHKKGFKDFWTNDMNTFYNESWGHENYDINAVHQSMPSDFSKWSVNTADQFPLKGKKRGPMCLRCREFGHFQFRCPKLQEPVKCATCGDGEHTTSRCPKSICTTCRSSTQHHTTSCNNCSNYKTIRCPICNYIGHLSRDCPDLWRRYHLTINDNNSVVASSQMLKPPNLLWCSNCANRGHSANNCNYLRTDHFPTYPGIQSYTPVYNNESFFLNKHPEPQIPVRVFENVNLSQIRNHRTELMEDNNKKYLNMIKNLRKHIGKSDDNINLNDRLNYLQNAANNNRFTKQKIGELYKISKILRNSR